VDTHDAKKRIPEAFEVYTFFGHHDYWLYNLSLKPTTCDRCIARATAFYYRGHQLRGYFPDLDITDEDRIEVNLHPNCGCWLSRTTEDVYNVLAG
jgi:hypothetical protein